MSALAPGSLDSATLASAFTLNVLPESWLDGGQAEISLEPRRVDGGIEVAVRARAASGLKALYLDIAYDPRTLRPTAARPTERFGPAGQVLNLAVFSDPGAVHYGQVLARPQEQAGFSGDGVLAVIHFARSLASLASEKTVAASSVENDYPLDWWNASELHWYHSVWGDYDQNGLVNISDLTPLAQHFGEKGIPSFNKLQAQALIDGDGNNEINIGDLTAIGANFGHSALGGFNIYGGNELTDYPASAQHGAAANSWLIAHVAIANGTLGTFLDFSAPDPRLEFNVQVMPQEQPAYYWVWTVDSHGQEWQASQSIDNWHFKESVSARDATTFFVDSNDIARWYYRNSGDYNQDGLVTYGDHGVLVEHWHASGPFDPGSNLSVLDADQNSEINISDIIPWAANWQREVAGYNLYTSDLIEDYPGFFGSPTVIQPLASLRLVQALGDPAQDRLRFEYHFTPATLKRYVWVRPFTNPGVEGIVSNWYDTQAL